MSTDNNEPQESYGPKPWVEQEVPFAWETIKSDFVDLVLELLQDKNEYYLLYAHTLYKRQSSHSLDYLFAKYCQSKVCSTLKIGPEQLHEYCPQMVLKILQEIQTEDKLKEFHRDFEEYEFIEKERRDFKLSKTFYYFNWLTFMILKRLMEKRTLRSRLYLLSIARRIYKDVLTILKLEPSEYMMRIDNDWIEYFFDRYDPVFILRRNFSDWAPSFEQLNSISERNVSLLSFLPDLNAPPEKLPQIPEPSEKVIIPNITLMPFRKSLTYTCSDATSQMIFTDDDDVATEVGYLSDLKITIPESEHEFQHQFTIDNLAFHWDLTTDQFVDICDCLKEDCVGCFQQCPKCGQKKCFAICRSLPEFHFDNVFVHYDSFEDKLEPLEKPRFAHFPKTPKIEYLNTLERNGSKSGKVVIKETYIPGTDYGNNIVYQTIKPKIPISKTYAKKNGTPTPPPPPPPPPPTTTIIMQMPEDFRVDA